MIRCINNEPATLKSGAAKIGETKYYPYGVVQEGGDEKYLYTGKELDKGTGLYYYEMRYYNPKIGRFIQADLLIPDPYNPQSLNRYAYVLNNPLRYVDPNGENAELTTVGLGRIVTGVMGAVAIIALVSNPIGLAVGLLIAATYANTGVVALGAQAGISAAQVDQETNDKMSAETIQAISISWNLPFFTGAISGGVAVASGKSNEEASQDFKSTASKTDYYSSTGLNTISFVHSGPLGKAWSFAGWEYDRYIYKKYSGINDITPSPVMPGTTTETETIYPSSPARYKKKRPHSDDEQYSTPLEETCSINDGNSLYQGKNNIGSPGPTVGGVGGGSSGAVPATWQNLGWSGPMG